MTLEKEIKKEGRFKSSLKEHVACSYYPVLFIKQSREKANCRYRIP